MSFGKNPHVAKAEAEEQKARAATDTAACAMAWREAARQWDRAEERELDSKRKVTYAARAELARQHADQPEVAGTECEPVAPRDRSQLN